MKKNEFILQLSEALKKNQVADAQDIIEEYEQHFSYKLADGYSEEEIANKLGKPEQIAMQYERAASTEPTGSGIITKIGMGFADIIVGMFFVLLAACGVVIAAASIAFAVSGVCMIFDASPYSVIPTMPYLCAAILGIALIALGILTAVGCIYYWAQIRQLLKAFGRFQHNTISSATGAPVLPSLSTHFQFAPKANRRLRTLAVFSLVIFAACFILGFIICMLSSGNISFWHTWGWFER